MKRVLKYLSISLSSILLSMQVGSAQAVVDAPGTDAILGIWQKLQMGKFAEQARNMIDQLNTTLEGLETAKNTYGEINKVYKAASALYSGVNEIYGAYNEAENLYRRSLYAYEYVQKRLASGDISLRDASYMLSTLEYLDRAGQKTLKDISDLIQDENLDVQFKLSKTKENWNYLIGLSKIVSHDLEDLDEDIKTDKMITAMGNMVTSAYGSGPIGELANPLGWRTDKQAQKDVESALSLGSSKTSKKTAAKKEEFDKEEVKKTAGNINRLGTSVLNIVSAIIALLFFIMAIPAYLRRNQGHQQSQDAIMKLFRGTIIIIIVIQVIGRLFFLAV